MQRNTPTESQIRSQFITSLMEYFKIEEDINLRAHVADLVRSIHPSQYREFFRRLSSRPMPFKNGFEKIAQIALEFEEETLTPIDREAQERAEKLYRLMYDIRQQIVLARDTEHSAVERFEQIRFTSIRRKEDDAPLLDATDINVIRALTKPWIYDYVSLDRGLFEARVTHEYRNEILRRERDKNEVIAAPVKAQLLSSGKQL
jgi:CRISPR/Cas system CSM-associated protein Csm2 small subunit